MIWQDYAIMVIQFGFAGALVPAVRGTEKPDCWTCFFTGLLLWLLSGVFLTLALWLSAFSTATAAAMWTVLLFQKRRVRRDQPCSG